jgi:hypothetical protein
VKKAELVPKELDSNSVPPQLHVPPLLDSYGQSIYSALGRSPSAEETENSAISLQVKDVDSEPMIVNSTGPWVCIGNVHKPFGGSAKTLESEAIVVFNNVKGIWGVFLMR